VQEVLASGWVSQGPKVEEFETRLAEVLGCHEVCAVNSGTSAIMLALRALDIGPGDSVVVPAFSCAASALPILEVGARPIFADIDPATFNVSWDTISRVLEKDTKAIMVAHMFGQICDMDVIAAECRRRNLMLVEDAALALGARRSNCPAGTFGLAGCFSFHPRKIVTTGEGGAVCTNDSELAARVRESRNYGAARTAWARFKSGDGSPRGFTRLAFNCKLTDIQAAIGLVQLRRLPDFLATRRRIARRYTEELAACSRLAVPSIPSKECEHVFQAYVCTWLPASFDELESRPVRLRSAERTLSAFKTTLSEQRVAVSDAAQFLPSLPVFDRKEARQECPYAYLVSRLAFALPIYPDMADSDVGRVLDAVKAGLANG
jgi:dTDP-4-amino-4,6-dideoxygalactose transaminase